jgi:hypothetical protein
MTKGLKINITVIAKILNKSTYINDTIEQAAQNAETGKGARGDRGIF